MVSDDPGHYYRLGRRQYEQQDYRAAELSLLNLLRIQPDSMAGRLLLGLVYAELGEHLDAISQLKMVGTHGPHPELVIHRIGRCYAALRRYDEAYNAYQDALRIKPDDVAVLCSLGLLFTELGQIGKAHECLMQAHAVNPLEVSVINNIGRLYKRMGRSDLACNWFRRGAYLQPVNRDVVSNYLNVLNYLPGYKPGYIAQLYKEMASDCFPPQTAWRSELMPRQAGPIRVGYLSGDFCDHSVVFFVEPVLQLHDRNAFKVYCYANQSNSDDTTRRIMQLCDGWRWIASDNDLQVAQQIADDRIDILVDLSGHTAGHRLGVFAYRPAPVQVSWIGHPNTTGMSQIDYYLTDAVCDPPGMTESNYSESLYRLPRIFSCYLPPEQFPAISPPPSVSSGTIMLGCFNNIAKINRELISWWSDILRKLENAVLYIKGPPLWDDYAREELLKSFRLEGIGEKRLIIQGETGTRFDHLACYAAVDIALDTFPYHGTTTTCEALWMGVPVVSLAGDSHVSRVGATLLGAVGLKDLVAETTEEYIATVVRLARDRQRLAELRENLRFMMASSPLMDTVGVTRDVEAAYLDMFRYGNRLEQDGRLG